MAFSHGKNAYFSLGSAGSESTEVDLSAYFDSLDFPQEVQTNETTTFGNDSRTYIVGLRDATFSGSGKFDPTPDAQLSGALGNATALNFTYGPAGNGTGSPEYTGTLFITSYDPSTSVDAENTFSFDAQITGDVTRGTF